MDQGQGHHVLAIAHSDTSAEGRCFPVLQGQEDLDIFIPEPEPLFLYRNSPQESVSSKQTPALTQAQPLLPS